MSKTYQVIRTDYSKDISALLDILTGNVSDAMAAGWTPLGSPVIDSCENQCACFQAMVRETETFPVEDGESLGTFLRRARKQLNLSMSQAATITGVSKGHIWRIEKDAAEPSLDVCVSLASAYNISVVSLARMAAQRKGRATSIERQFI